MDNVFHQTDETFFETQYSEGFPNRHPGTNVTSSSSSMRPATANEDGLQMKRLLEPETGQPKEQQYRERWHQLHRSQEDRVGVQKFLRTVDSPSTVKQLTHGVKSKVESNFASILFPGHDHVAPDHSNGVGDARCQTLVTHGKRTNSDRSGGCLWKILNHDALPTPPPAPARVERGDAAGKTLQRCLSAPCRTYNIITQEADHQDAPGVNKALHYLHKLRTLLSHTGAVQRTKKDMIGWCDGGQNGAEEQRSDWNGLLLKHIGTRGTLDYAVLEPLLLKLKIDLGAYDGFTKFLDLLDTEVSLTRFELGKHMQQSVK